MTGFTRPSADLAFSIHFPPIKVEGLGTRLAKGAQIISRGGGAIIIIYDVVYNNHVDDRK